MTAQEQQMLQGLTERISKNPLAEKDDEAEQYLQQTLGRNPDALYMLSQTVLVQQYALDQAQKQLADARSQLEAARQAPPPPKHSGSFLGNLLGMNDEPKAPPPPQQYAPVPNYPQQPPQYAQPQYSPQYGAPQYAQPGYAAPPQSGGFLRSAMQTATGVAAGALAFEGIESLMHGFGGGHSGAGGYGFEGGGNQGRPEEIVNNYYGDASPHEHSGGLGSDIEDRRGDTRGFADTGSDRDSGDDVSTVDANAADDVSDDFSDTSNDASDDFTSDDASSSSDDSSF